MKRVTILIALIGLIIAGCAGTVRLEKVNEVTLCTGGNCGPVDQNTDLDALRGALYRLFKSNQGGTYKVCASSPTKRECSDQGLSHFVQGGPIPGLGTLTGMEIEEVGYDPSVAAIVAIVDPDMYFIGTPLITTKHKTVLKVAGPNLITLEDQESYTNWMVVGNQVFNFNFAADYVDIDRGILGGWYGWGVTGIGTGGGNGYALITFSHSGSADWFAAVPDDALILSVPVTDDQEDPIAEQAKITVASGSGVTAEEAADHANKLEIAQKRIALVENILTEEAKRTEQQRLELAKRNEDLAREQRKRELARKADIAKRVQEEREKEEKALRLEEERISQERKLLEQERQRLEEIRQSADNRRKELEALYVELEKQKQETLKLQEERQLAELERQRIEEKKKEEQERLEALKMNIHFGNYHALIIGNNEYTNIPRLNTAINDSKVIADILQNKYKFKTTLLTNATRGQILRALNHFRKSLNKDDNLLIYYAGHGWLDKAADEGYWLPVDADTDDPVNWIANSSITASITAINAKHVMVVADSCYSGKLMRGIKIREKSSDVLEKLAKKRTRVVLSSGGLEPVTDEGSGDHSIFASAFINVLRENNGIIDGTQLFNLVRKPVMANADQTPEYADIHKAGHDGGDFIFVRR
jgi:hypothetical protein